MKINIPVSLFLLVLFGCASNDLKLPAVKGQVNAETIVRERQEVIFPTSSEDIRIEVLEIEEARCPGDVACIWAGYVKVSFRISVPNATVALALPPNQPPGPALSDNYSFALAGNTYRLVLKDVTPYPTRDNSNSVKSAVFQLEAL